MEEGDIGSKNNLGPRDQVEFSYPFFHHRFIH